MFADDYRPGCFWTRDAALPAAPSGPPPLEADVVVVGGGYTGLAAARETALAGLSTVVLDAGEIGGAASARNGGQVAFSIKPTHASLSRRYGDATATRIYEEGLEAVESLRGLVCNEGLDCGWQQAGCFIGAHTPRLFGEMVRAAEAQPRGLEIPFEVIPRERQSEVVDTTLYHGGILYPTDAAVHPVKLVRALHARAQAAGAEFRSHCGVAGVERGGAEFEVRTAHGAVRARKVLIATNAYTGSFAPWHRRRVLPIGSYIIATEMLEPAVVERLIPCGRNIGDTRRVVVYYRPSPDGRRIVFGGRAAARETDVVRCMPRLRAMMSEIFPELARVRISSAWMGLVAFTFDTLPHLGQHEGVYYCMGYCGQGVPSAVYYGRKIGLAMAGRPGAETALMDLPFESRPLYTGDPWFLPAAVMWYRLLDRLGV